MQQVVLVGSVAGLAHQVYRSHKEEDVPLTARNFDPEQLQRMMGHTSADNQAPSYQRKDPNQPNSSELIDYLERWEEPDRGRQETVSAAQRPQHFKCFFGSQTGHRVLIQEKDHHN